MKLFKTVLAVASLLAMVNPAYAQSAYTAVQQGVGIARNATAHGRTNLPPTTMDSFVYQAGGMADLIYGDEGDIDIPPLDSYTKASRINSGIFGVRDAGLTTGHGSFMPDATGGDEWTGQEWDMSGPHNYNPKYNIEATALNAAQAAVALAARAALPSGVNTSTSNSSITSSANVNGTAAITYMQNPPAWISAFGTWATQVVPYPVTEGMKPVQDSTTGALMGWMAPGDSLSSFLNGSTGRLLPGETAQAATMLQNLTSDYTL